MKRNPNNKRLNSKHPHELQGLVLELLKNRLWSFSIGITETGIVLHGACNSFHAKQMAQEIVSQHTDLPIAANNLVVHYSRLPIAPTDISDDINLFRSNVSEDDTPKDIVSVNSAISTEETSMNQQRSFERIFLPSDFSSDSDVAFVHALKIATECKAALEMMWVSPVNANSEMHWDDFPSVRSALERWRVIPEGSSQETVVQLGVEISKIVAFSPDPVNACLDYLEVQEVDLIVLSVHQREGVMRWLGKMIAERISSASKQTTLFLPVGRNGFVSPETGAVTLKNILIPMVKKPRSEPSVEFVKSLIHSLDLVTGSVTLLHVGPSETMPFVQHPLSNGWTWNRIRLEGERTETIVQFAKDLDAHLIVMTTDGPDRFLDGLRGTTSERVLRKAHCPVAVIPVESVTE